uniref:Somatoliberin n=2 Tax=Denticeps clupeoides TaxID=299321 RepID=A0AAY4ELM4_9TELE
MMERSALLVLCLVIPLSSSPLHPSLRFGQRAASFLMSSSLEELPSDYSSSPTKNAVFRSGRHADAIFTNSYRKVLGQISARKFLQTIMGKRPGEEMEGYVKRQSAIYEDSYKQDLTTIKEEERFRGQQQGVKRLR